MANSFGTETPPAPDPDSSNALMSGGGAAPSPQNTPPGAPGQPQQQQPAPPSHEETIAALRHFDAVRKELELIMANPKLGKSSVKDPIIKGVTRLVASGFLTPVKAVDQLASVPQEPLMQLKWAKGMLTQAKQAENGILDHYGAGNPNLGSVQDHFAGTKGMSQMDDHQDHMSALAANYSTGKR